MPSYLGWCDTYMDTYIYGAFFAGKKCHVPFRKGQWDRSEPSFQLPSTPLLLLLIGIKTIKRGVKESLLMHLDRRKDGLYCTVLGELEVWLKPGVITGPRSKTHVLLGHCIRTRNQNLCSSNRVCDTRRTGLVPHGCDSRILRRAKDSVSQVCRALFSMICHRDSVNVCLTCTMTCGGKLMDESLFHPSQASLTSICQPWRNRNIGWYGREINQEPRFGMHAIVSTSSSFVTMFPDLWQRQKTL